MQLFCKQLDKDLQPAHLAAPCPSAPVQSVGTHEGPDGRMQGTGAEEGTSCTARRAQRLEAGLSVSHHHGRDGFRCSCL